MQSLNNSSRENRGMISIKDYTDLKPYWDHQRKIEYNKEQLRNQIMYVMEDLHQYNNELVTDERDYIFIDEDQMFEHFWNMIDYSDMKEPPKAWIPQNTMYQIEGELHGRLVR